MKKTNNLFIAVLSFILLLTMAFGLVGCNNEPTTPGPGDDPVTVVTVTLNKFEIVVDEHAEAQQLKATVKVDGEVVVDPELEWSSSNTAVATVDATGLVSVVSMGEAVITCTYQGVSGDCRITVQKYYAPDIALSLAKSELLVSKFVSGYQANIVASVVYKESGEKANATITYVSSDLNVATVDSNGKVTIVGPGECVIKVTANLDGATSSKDYKVIVMVDDSEGTFVPDGSWN